jgi:hypothetical protein
VFTELMASSPCSLCTPLLSSKAVSELSSSCLGYELLKIKNLSLTKVSMKIILFRDMIPCNLVEVNQHCRRTYCFNIQGRRITKATRRKANIMQSTCFMIVWIALKH